MEIDGPTFVSKVAIFSNLGQGLSQKDGFFFIFDPNLEDGFFRTSFFKQEIHLCACLWLFNCCTFTILPKYCLKSLFFTKKVS